MNYELWISYDSDNLFDEEGGVVEMDAVSLFLVYSQFGSCDEVMHAFALSEWSIAVASSSDQCRRHGLSIYILHIVFKLSMEHRHECLSQIWIMGGSEIIMSSEETVEWREKFLWDDIFHDFGYTWEYNPLDRPVSRGIVGEIDSCTIDEDELLDEFGMGSCEVESDTSAVGVSYD